MGKSTTASKAGKDAEGPTWRRRRKLKETGFSEKRDAVLATAARLFAERGHDAVSLNLLAEALTITKPSLYYYFKSKEEILFEIKQRAQDMVLEAIDEVDRDGGTGLEKLHRLLLRYIDIVASDYVRCLIVVGREHLDPRSRAKIQGRGKEGEERIIGFIAEGMKDGSIRKQEVKILYQSLFGMINSIAVWFKDSGPVKRDQMAQQVLSLAIDGMRGPQG